MVHHYKPAMSNGYWRIVETCHTGVKQEDEFLNEEMCIDYLWAGVEELVENDAVFMRNTFESEAHMKNGWTEEEKEAYVEAELQTVQVTRPPTIDEMVTMYESYISATVTATFIEAESEVKQ